MVAFRSLAEAAAGLAERPKPVQIAGLLKLYGIAALGPASRTAAPRPIQIHEVAFCLLRVTAARGNDTSERVQVRREFVTHGLA